MRKATDRASLHEGKLGGGWYQGQERVMQRVMQSVEAAEEGSYGDSGVPLPEVVLAR